jgi:membrane glycosyltransferase
MSPVVLGLIVSIPIGLLTSQRLRSPGVLATPEDMAPPAVVARAAELANAPRIEAGGALARLREDADLAADHLANLPPPRAHKGGRVDVALATARAKLDLCETFADAEGWLDKAETRALLGDRDLLARTLALA